MYVLTKQITWEAVQGARRAEAEIVWIGLWLSKVLRLRAPQQYCNAPKELF